MYEMCHTNSYAIYCFGITAILYRVALSKGSKVLGQFTDKQFHGLFHCYSKTNEADNRFGVEKGFTIGSCFTVVLKMKSMEMSM